MTSSGARGREVVHKRLLREVRVGELRRGAI